MTSTNSEQLRAAWLSFHQRVLAQCKELAAARRDPITHQLHDAAGNVIDSMPNEAAVAAPKLPSSEEVAQADMERARRWRMAYRDMQENGPSWMSEEARYAADGNNTPFPVGS